MLPTPASLTGLPLALMVKGTFAKEDASLPFTKAHNVHSGLLNLPMALCGPSPKAPP